VSRFRRYYEVVRKPSSFGGSFGHPLPLPTAVIVTRFFLFLPLAPLCGQFQVGFCFKRFPSNPPHFQQRLWSFPGSWRIPLDSCRRLETPVGLGWSRITTIAVMPSMTITMSAPTIICFRGYPDGLFPCCLRFRMRVTPASSKTRFQLARYGFGWSGLSPLGFFIEFHELRFTYFIPF
jgi:hypothetical protein